MPFTPRYAGELPTLGWEAISWMQTYLARPETMEYEPLILTREQAEFLLRFYELDPISSARKQRRGVLSRPRGWGKSPISGGIAAFEAMGPAHPDGFDADGRPVGRPWSDFRKPLVEIAAVSEQQVDTNTWSPLVDMLSHDLVMDAYPGLEPMANHINLPYGRIQKRTAEATSAKGAPAHFVVADQALALDTPIPTPTGWTTMGALQAGDFVYGSGGTPVVVSEAKPFSTDHKCYRLSFEDGTSVTASAGHLWSAKLAGWPPAYAGFEVRTTEQMRDGRRYRIPVAPAQEMAAAGHRVTPYLLGLWLGDGTRGKCELTVGEGDLADTQEALAAVGVETWARRYAIAGTSSYGGTPAVNLTFSRCLGYQAADRPEAARALAALPCYLDKHVPTEFFAGSIAERTDLVRGLMDSDGSVSLSGGCVFVSTSARISSGLVRLLRSLGQVTSGGRWVADDRYTGGGKWLVHFTPRGDFQPFALPRKANRVRNHRQGAEWISIVSIDPVENVAVRCIGVDSDDHLFAFGKSGHLTHNTESWVSGNGGRKLYNTLKNNVIKRGGTLLETPNAYTPGENSVAETTMVTYQQIMSGKTRQESGVYFDHREAPPLTDFTDPVSLMQGLAIAYGDSADIEHCAIHNPPCHRPGWVNLDHIASSIYDPDTDVQLARSDWLNQITHATDAFLSQTAWAAIADPTKVLSDRDMVVLGFDGSRGRAKGKPDATALIGCRVEDGHLYEIEVWEAGPFPNHGDGPSPDGCDCWQCWAPPIPEIERAIAAQFERFVVAGFYADPGKDWRSHINQWEATYGDRVQFKASPNHPFEWWMGGGRSGLVERAIEQFESAVAHLDMTHDGSSDLTRHVLNARRRLSHGKLALAKENDYSPNKIDAGVAAILAYQARLDALVRATAPVSEFYVPRRLM